MFARKPPQTPLPEQTDEPRTIRLRAVLWATIEAIALLPGAPPLLRTFLPGIRTALEGMDGAACTATASMIYEIYDRVLDADLGPGAELLATESALPAETKFHE